VEIAVRRTFLTDEQLWRAIAENTTELSKVMEAESVPATGADIVHIARRAVQFNKLQRQYRIYTSEIRRRYS
jgi:hypothetical protein